jgi:hypothetical protein
LVSTTTIFSLLDDSLFDDLVALLVDEEPVPSSKLVTLPILVR